MKFTTIMLCAVFCLAALFLGSAQGTIHPYSPDCSKFMNCDEAKCDVMSCGPGTEFNPVENTCDYPVNPHPGCTRH